MHSGTVLDLCQRALAIALQLSLIPTVAAALIGIVLAIFQAVTSIQDQTLPQSVKIIAILGLLMIFGAWMCSVILAFGEQLFRNFPAYVRG